MKVPPTRYATVNGAHVAYQSFGSGRPLLLLLGLSTHVEAMWEEPNLAQFLQRFGRFSTTTVFDRRGAGLSDALGDVSTLEAHVDDAGAVLRAVGAEDVAVVAANEASLIALPLAASQPGLVRSLTIINGTAKFMRSDDYPIGAPWPAGRAYVAASTTSYVEGEAELGLSAPSMASDPAFLAWARRYQRAAASPGSFRTTTRLVGQTDARPALQVLTCPVLVVHRRDNRFIRADHGRFIADHVRDGTWLEIDGADHLPWVGPDTGRMLDAVETFVTGVEVVPTSDRILATILFTDIVASTDRLAAVGDHDWSTLLSMHEAVVTAIVDRYGGRVVDTAGDGVFAIFDHPSRSIEAATVIQERSADLGVNVRAGLHTGEVELAGDAVRGIAVHTAARVMGAAPDGGVVSSRTLRDLTSGSRFVFEPIGPHKLKGLAEPIELFRILPQTS